MDTLTEAQRQLAEAIWQQVLADTYPHLAAS